MSSSEPIFERLPCALSDTEVLSKSTELSHKLNELTDLENKKKAAAATFSTAIKEVNTRIHELGEMVRTREEYRQVECREERAFESNVVKIVRKDTGAKVRERAMDAKERQEELFAGHTKVPREDGDDDDDGFPAAEALEH